MTLLLTLVLLLVTSVAWAQPPAQGSLSRDTEALTMAGCVRADAAAVASGVGNGDRARCIVDATGAVWVHVTAIDGTVTVTGPLTDAQLRATPVPVSGPLTDAQLRASPVPVSAAALPLPTGASTAVLQDGIVKDGAGDTTQANVSGGRLHVDPSGVTSPISAAALPLPTGASTEASLASAVTALQILDDWDESDRAKVNLIAGQAGVQGGSGTVSASTVRVVHATDVNAPVNVIQIGGVAPSMGTTQPPNAQAGLTIRQPVSCTNRIAISQTADTQVITGVSGQRIYICAILLIASAAETINLIEGTGSVCATSPTALYGSTTEGNGMALAANGGFSQASGQPFVHTGVDANNLCLTQVGAARISGSISYIVAAD